MSVKQFFYILPFSCFGIGYLLMYFMCTPPSVTTPDLIGKSLLYACECATALNLNIKILSHKYDIHDKPGTVLQQNPSPGTSIKPHQSLYVTVAKQPEPVYTPPLYTIHRDSILTHISHDTIKVAIHELPSSYPSDTCFAQSPLPGQPIKNNHLTVYISKDSQLPMVWPDFTGYTVHEVRLFLQKQGLTASYTHQNNRPCSNQCVHCIITSQIPSSGSLITPAATKKMIIAFEVAPG